MKYFIENRVDDGEYGSVSEYFRELIRKDQQQAREQAKEAASGRSVRRLPLPRGETSNQEGTRPKRSGRSSPPASVDSPDDNRRRLD
jgi:Arc/MetJ-type ribon-helix-helix transcriptional regulator